MFIPLAYLSVILIWSTTPLAIQWSAQEFGPGFAVFGRMVIGLSICLLALGALRQPLPLHRLAWLTYLVGGLSFFVSMSCVYWGAQSVPSGLIAVLFGLVPLFSSIIAAVWLGEHSLTSSKMAGIVLGIAGLGIIFVQHLRLDAHSYQGVLAILAAAWVHSVGLVAIKRLGSECGAIAAATGTLLVALPGFGLLWLLDGAPVPHLIGSRGLWALIYLGVFGSALGFILYYALIRRLPASQVALITLITPVSALLLGRWLNQEMLTPTLLLGTACILTGLSIHQGWLFGWPAPENQNRSKTRLGTT